jgi:ATP/maltotriose-dependent transcriptional regulator MalT
MPLADAHRWRAAWDPLLVTVQRAIAVADELDDVERLASAASAMTVGALWQSAHYGTTHDDVIAALRRSLAGLPDTDGEMRCRVMMALANELYYTTSFEERTALVEQAVAMADRLGDDALRIEARQVGAVSIWQPDNAELRHDLAREAMELAEASGNERGYVAAATYLTIVLGELGRVAEMREMLEVARDRAERLQFPYGLLVLDSMEVAWLAMAGRFDEAEACIDRLGRLIQDVSMRQAEDAWAASVLALRLWQGRTAEVVPIMYAFEEGPIPVTPTVLTFLLRAGDDAAARSHAAAHPLTIVPPDWMAMLNWGCAAEAALGLADQAKGAAAYAVLAPYAGRTVCAGSGNAMGPVDAFLALAAATVGDLDLAARHADDAERLMEEWQIPLAAQWLRDQRDRHGF